MQDRVPLHPGRVKLAPVAGEENTFDMTRADEPTQEGTPLNKATLLQDWTAALYGLGTDATPDDVFFEMAPRVGDIKATARDDVDGNWLLCDGSVCLKADYPDLHAVMDKYTTQPMVYAPEQSASIPTNIGLVHRVNGIYFALGGVDIYASKDFVTWTKVYTATVGMDYVKYVNGMYIVWSSGNLTKTAFAYAADPFGAWKENTAGYTSTGTIADVIYFDGNWIFAVNRTTYAQLRYTTDLAVTPTSYTGANVYGLHEMYVYDGALWIVGHDTNSYAQAVKIPSIDGSVTTIWTSDVGTTQTSFLVGDRLVIVISQSLAVIQLSADMTSAAAQTYTIPAADESARIMSALAEGDRVHLANVWSLSSGQYGCQLLQVYNLDTSPTFVSSLAPSAQSANVSLLATGSNAVDLAYAVTGGTSQVVKIPVYDRTAAALLPNITFERSHAYIRARRRLYGQGPLVTADGQRLTDSQSRSLIG